jgi:F-type H+-transporting ATPase subunit b
MPQLNVSDFMPQVVWLVISFTVFYFLLKRLALPSIARTLGARESRLQGDIERAQKLKAEAEAALAAYEKAIAQARLKAQGELKDVAAAMATEASRRQGELAASVAEKTLAAETRIAQAKQAALADLRGVAGDAAKDLVARLSGAEPGVAELAAAVAAASDVQSRTAGEQA